LLLISGGLLVVHGAVLLAAGPLVVGLVRLLKARLLGRRGASVLQPWRDIRRLGRKEAVLAENASFLFAAAPAVVLAATAVAGLLVPSFSLGLLTAPVADLLVIFGLLALARVVLGLAAMDVGTAFGGLGASRSLTMAVFAEPALLLVCLSLALLSGTTSLEATAGLLREGGLGLRVSLGLCLLAMIAVALVENGRLPTDNPSTHLELTMLHEAALLDYSARHLALLELAGALRLAVWLSLIGTLFFPVGLAEAGAGPLAWLVGLAAWGGKLVLLAAGLATLEVCVARMRLFRVPEFLGLAVLLGLLAALFLFVSTGFV
jgi:formate hydrogenlyase subunit 4